MMPAWRPTPVMKTETENVLFCFITKRTGPRRPAKQVQEFKLELWDHNSYRIYSLGPSNRYSQSRSEFLAAGRWLTPSCGINVVFPLLLPKPHVELIKRVQQTWELRRLWLSPPRYISLCPRDKILSLELNDWGNSG